MFLFDMFGRYGGAAGGDSPSPPPPPATSVAAFAPQLNPDGLASGAGTATIAWFRPTHRVDNTPLTAGDILNYKVRWASSAQGIGQARPGGTYTADATVSASTFSHQITGLAAGTWYVTVTCLVNASPESDASFEFDAVVT